MTDETTAIDPETGLPALPEGCFWRIGTSSVKIVKRVPAGEWGQWREDFPGRVLASPSRLISTQVEYRDREVEVDRKEHELRFGGWTRFFMGPPEPLQPALRRVTEVRTRTRASVETLYEMTATSENDEDNLIERCREALRNWEITKRAEAVSGDYPPRRLGQGQKEAEEGVE